MDSVDSTTAISDSKISSSSRDPSYEELANLLYKIYKEQKDIVDTVMNG